MFYGPGFDLSWWNFHVILRKMCILLLLNSLWMSKIPADWLSPLPFRCPSLGAESHGVSAPFCCDSLDPPVCLFNLGATLCPVASLLFRIQELLISFSLFWFSFVVRMEWLLLQALYMWNWQPEVPMNNLIIFISNIHHIGKRVLGVKVVWSKNCTPLTYRG